MKNKQQETLSTRRAERTTKLIASFVGGFAEGWYMALKESFKMELDIKYTERKKNKISYYEWTQGPYFCFSEGQLFFDTKEAYVYWQSALSNVNLACQIIAAKPDSFIKTSDDVTGKIEYQVLEGYVQFLLYKPTEERTCLTPFIGYKLSQNKFVNFLKTGEL
ncbi:MAG: hypothetical protein PHY09_06815 [Desulfuromonadaceae bacterium]|nr:hypothetical protein [Desulfuromonadaceae bacterium]MDD5104769.1 hypothetical protein [Desulfuromonadaceae bacterium]